MGLGSTLYMGLGSSYCTWDWGPVTVHGTGVQLLYMGLGSSYCTWDWGPVTVHGTGVQLLYMGLGSMYMELGPNDVCTQFATASCLWRCRTNTPLVSVLRTIEFMYRSAQLCSNHALYLQYFSGVLEHGICCKTLG